MEALQALAGSVVFIALMALLAGAYFMPTVAAWRRHHRNLGGIAFINLLFGWTLIGWAVAMLWATHRSAAEVQQRAAPRNSSSDRRRCSSVISAQRRR